MLADSTTTLFHFIQANSNGTNVYIVYIISRSHSERSCKR